MMRAPASSPALSQGVARLARGWPVLAGLMAFAIGLVMLAGAIYFHRQAKQLLESSAARPAEPVRSGVANTVVPADALATALPRHETHLDDMSLLFRLAKDQGVSLGGITYRWESNAAIPVTVRSLELRVEEEYPKLKAFVSELLRRMPHLYLEEIRVEQGNTPTTRVQATLKLAFAYEGSLAKGPQ